MANEERRSGNPPPPPLDDDEPIEATRAIRLDEIPAAPPRAPQPAAQPRPMPRPMQPTGGAPQGPRPVARPASPPPVPEEEEGGDATRVFEAADVPGAEAATRAIDTSALSGVRPAQKPLTPMELRAVSGPDRGKIHRVPEGKHLVGRGLDCNIVLADPAVSRKHFQIERVGDEAVLSDLGGANGTNINGTKKPRHVLESGDRIEIGTSVLEFFIEGAQPIARNRQAMPERQASATPQVLFEKAAARKKLAVRLGIVFAIVAVGGGVGAYLATRKPAAAAKPAAQPVQDEGAAEVEQAITKAKELLADTPPDFSNALDILKAAKKKDPTNAELKKLIASTRKEVDAEDTFEEAKQALKAGDFQGAINKFGEVESDTQKYADAQDELAAAKETLFSQRMTEAKRANEAGDTAAAVKSLDAILAVDPNRAEAKAMRAQLAGDGDEAKAPDAAKPAEVAKADTKPAEAAKPAAPPAAPAKPEPAPSKPAAAPVAKQEVKAAPHVVVGGKPEPAKPDSGTAVEAAAKPEAKPTKPEAAKNEGKKADFGAGLSAYHNRQWTPAVQAFDEIANGPYAKDQKAKAAGFSAAVRAVETALNEAQAAGSNTRKAIAAWKQAYNADRRVDGIHGGFIAGKLADNYLAQAKAELAAKKYAEAFEDAQEALNYQPEKAEANQIVDKCMAQATTMLKDAKDLMDKKNYLGARDLARTVAHILPASDKRAQEAQEMAKKATELSRQDAD